MSSYKCPQCGLVNWNVAEMCKRCAAPNPYLAPASPEAFQAPAADVQAYQQQTSQPYQQQYAPQPQTLYGQPQQGYAPQQQYASQDYNSPPPPSVYGAGSANYNGTYGQPQGYGGYQQQGYAAYNSYQSFMPDDVAQELEKANKRVKYAKSAATVWAVLAGIATVLILFLSSYIGGQAANPKLEPIKDMMSAILLFMVCYTALIGGMAYGISRKSMFCAVVFFIITCLGLLGSLASLRQGGGQALAQILFAVVMFICAINGLIGISDFNKIKKQYPDPLLS